MNNELRKKEIWNFTYRGIACEIVHWGIDKNSEYFRNGTWNGYLYINRKQLPRDFRKLLCKENKYKGFGNRKHWDYYKVDKYFDFHGEITYYELLLDEFTGKSTGIKVGDDYAHSFDSGMTYDENDIKRNLEKCVDAFIKNFPNYKIWDGKDGKYKTPNKVN